VLPIAARAKIASVVYFINWILVKTVRGWRMAHFLIGVPQKYPHPSGSAMG
jgi:hypothetical protein